MSKPSKGGKLPVSQKKNVATDLFMDDDSVLAIDPELQREIEAKGLAFRWINASKYKNGGNFHKAGWRAYRRESSSGSEFEGSPDGFIQRNDLLLAVKPKEAHERKRAQIQQRADLMAGVQASRASELKDKLKSAGMSSKVYEGYEGNGEQDDADLE